MRISHHIRVRGTKRDACRVDAELNCIKGGGACQLREKVLAEAAKTFVCLFVFPCRIRCESPTGSSSSLTTERTRSSWVLA